jgi:hypothetical protein
MDMAQVCISALEEKTARSGMRTTSVLLAA